jgi:hypothetical protein
MIETSKAETEEFQRSLETEMSPARKKEIVNLLTGDRRLAAKAEAWQILNNMP